MTCMGREGHKEHSWPLIGMGRKGHKEHLWPLIGMGHKVRKEHSRPLIGVGTRTPSILQAPCPRITSAHFTITQDSSSFSTVCVTDTCALGGKLLGIVTPRDVDFVIDRNMPLSEVMTK